MGVSILVNACRSCRAQRGDAVEWQVPVISNRLNGIDVFVHIALLGRAESDRTWPRNPTELGHGHECDLH